MFLARLLSITAQTETTRIFILLIEDTKEPCNRIFGRELKQKLCTRTFGIESTILPLWRAQDWILPQKLL